MEDKKGKVGPFFYIASKIISDSVNWDQAEKYGDFKTWGSHYNFWDVLSDANWEFRELDYNYFPRGRVTYNFVQDKYYIYLNPKLNKEKILAKIIKEYDLSGLNYVVDDKDEHYQS